MVVANFKYKIFQIPYMFLACARIIRFWLHTKAKPSTVLNILNMEKKRSRRIVRSSMQKQKIVDRKVLIKNKTSDTLFILGSGPSINKITDEGWGHIANHDSIALNWFFPHCFIPTFHHMELRKSGDDLFKYCITARDSKNIKSEYLLNFNYVGDRLHRNSYIQRELVYSVPAHFHKAKDLDELRVFIQYLILFNLIEDGYLLHIRASLTIAISIGVMLGYKNIVLCGFDMGSMEYFYDNEEIYKSEIAERIRSYKNKRLKEKYADSNCHRGFHRTVENEDSGAPPLHEVVFTLNQELLNQKNIALSLFSKDSLLYPSLPVYQPASCCY